VRGFGLHAVVPRSHEGPHPALVQHGGLRQPGQGGSAPGQKGRGMKKATVSKVNAASVDDRPTW
jgi:hypothetical protein